jgi:2-phosphoglycerate kinase
MKDIFLIGGVAGSGKSTIAEQLALHLRLPWFSTDQIRRILRPSEEDEFKKLELVWNGTSALLQGIHPWNGGIIEGTAILPEFIERDLKGIPNIRPIFLIQTEDQIIEIVEQRSKLPYIKTKTPEQKAERIRQIVEQNIAIQQKAKELGYPCVEARQENTFSEVLSILGSSPR